MRTLAIIVALIFLVKAVGQLAPTETLSVSGAAQLTIKPDLTVLDISVSEVKPQMGEAIKSLREKSNYYTDVFKRMGFDEKEIKTTGFTVSKNRVHSGDAFIDSGYMASHNIILKFTYEQEKLQKIISEFAESEKPVEFSLRFELSEQLKQSVQAQLIDDAVKNGKEKAKNIAKSAGIKLGGIKSISHGYGPVWDAIPELSVKRDGFMAATSGDNLKTFNLTPDYIVFRDELPITWEIR